MDREVFDLKNNKKLLILCLLVPLAVGGIAALLTGDGMDTFETLSKPPLSPPGWLFPVVWTVLYLLMGFAIYLVLNSGESEAIVNRAVWTYAVQLAFNFVWPILFFGGKMYLLAFIWLVALWLLILLNIVQFHRLDKRAGLLLLPYILWVSFAGYLNLGICLLN